VFSILYILHVGVKYSNYSHGCNVDIYIIDAFFFIISSTACVSTIENLLGLVKMSRRNIDDWEKILREYSDDDEPLATIVNDFKDNISTIKPEDKEELPPLFPKPRKLKPVSNQTL